MRTAPISTPNAPRRNAAGFFRWEDPGEPIAVHFHLNAVELLDRDAIQAKKTVPAGMLLGKRDDGPNPTFVIENYEPVPVATWKTTDSPFGDRRQMKAMIDRWRSKPNRRMDVLGFYRSCTAGETRLTEDDLSVLGENSTQPESVFLLIEPRSGLPSNGHLFLAKDSVVTWEWRPIPFNRSELSGRGSPRRTEVRNSPVTKEIPRISEEPKEVRVPIEDEPPNQRKWQWTIGALAIAVLLAVGIFQFRSRVTTKAPAPKAELSSDSRLGLKFEREGTDLRLSWNPEAAAILKATGGQLLINDGPVSKTVNLDASDLRSGTIIYSPLTDDLVFRLQVNAPDASEPLSESVRIVGGLPTVTSAPVASSADPSAAVNSQSGLRQTANVDLSDEALREIQRTVAPADTPSNRSNPISAGATKYEAGRPGSASNPSLRPEPSARLPEETLTVSKRLPSPTSQTKAQPASGAGRSAVAANSRGSAVASKAAAPLLATAPVKAPVESIPVIPAASSSIAFSSSLPRYVRRGGAVQPAQLLTNINPAYPAAAKQVGISGSVELHFKISTAGDVHDIVVVEGPLVLAQAAVDAVRERRYKPARVDGVPTETDASAIFDFKLN